MEGRHALLLRMARQMLPEDETWPSRREGSLLEFTTRWRKRRRIKHAAEEQLITTPSNHRLSVPVTVRGPLAGSGRRAPFAEGLQCVGIARAVHVVHVRDAHADGLALCTGTAHIHDPTDSKRPQCVPRHSRRYCHHPSAGPGQRWGALADYAPVDCTTRSTKVTAAGRRHHGQTTSRPGLHTSCCSVLHSTAPGCLLLIAALVPAVVLAERPMREPPLFAHGA